MFNPGMTYKMNINKIRWLGNMVVILDMDDRDLPNRKSFKIVSAAACRKAGPVVDSRPGSLGGLVSERQR